MRPVSMKLKRNHTWKAKAGNKICVLDRGLVRFEYPSHWVDEPGEGAVHLHDRPPSVESCDLGVSIFHISAEELKEVGLDQTLRATLGQDREPYKVSDIHRLEDPERTILWIEERYIEKQYKRDARFRVALVSGRVLVLITMNYWSNRASGLERVWDEVLRSVMFGDEIKDPTMGPVVQ